MRRREFVILIGATAAAWPFSARAQQSDRVRRIGVLTGGVENDSVSQARISAFRSTLASLGWIEGRNVVFDYRYDSVSPSDIERGARELLQSRPDAILVQGTLQTIELRHQTSTIPIVFVGSSDPLASGLIASLAHPGANVTGFSNIEFSVGGKWLGLLKEVAPDIKRVMVIMALDNPGNDGELKAIEEAGVRLGVDVVAARVQDREAIARALDAFGSNTNNGLIALTTNIATDNRDLIIERAERYRLPAIYPLRAFVTDGGLMSYGSNVVEQYRQAAAYIDRILRGDRPGDLPVEYPSKYELVVNNRAAKAIGLTLSESFLLLADEVIE